MTGKIVFGKDRTHYFIDRVEVSAKAFLEAFPDKPMATEDGDTALSAVPEMVSEAMAVPIKSIKAHKELAKAHGVPTEFDKHGRPIFTSRDHQRRYAQIHGFVNKDDNWSAKNYGVRPRTEEELRAEIFDG
jgi:hypothetical protein